MITIALAGNPNAGKTTLFNALTGSRQHVGNYPGVTVEIKEGNRRHHGETLRFIDLPGTYSLTAHSEEEKVARDFIVEQKPDVVVNVVDASNLERNLYLTLQLRELGVPLVVALNMADHAESMGLEFDLDALRNAIGARVVRTVGHRAEGIPELLDAVREAALDSSASAGAPSTSPSTGQTSPPSPGIAIDYGPEVDAAIDTISTALGGDRTGPGPADPRWLALKLLEQDVAILQTVKDPSVAAIAARTREAMEDASGEPAGSMIAGSRYAAISELCARAVRGPSERRRSISDRIDAWVTHRIVGIPIFLAMMYLVFHLTFTLGAPFMDWIEGGVDFLAEGLPKGLPSLAGGTLMSLLVDGIVRGVGGVVIFLPNILFLFLAIAILEDTGYMARAAFIMDRMMSKIGLHGKSFIAMLVGFGCSVPAILATRTLENRRDRLTTMMVVPLMSCGARLPIYALIIPAFFPPAAHGPMLWLIYVIGIALAVLSAKLLRRYVLPGESVPFVMELPPYRLPTPLSVLLHTWDRGWLYLKKAGTVILGISIVLWALTSFPKLPNAPVSEPAEAALHVGPAATASTLAVQEQEEPGGLPLDEQPLDDQRGHDRVAEELAYSAAGRIGRAMEPVLRPMGFDWRIGTALIGAFAAKEVFVAQMSIVFAVGETDEESPTLRDRLRSEYSPLVGFCIMLFCLVSAPCVATIAATRRESGSWAWALGQLAGLTALAYVLTVLTYQIGRLVGWG